MDEVNITLSFLALTACLAHGGWLVLCLLTGRRQLAASSMSTALLLCCSLLLAAGVNWAASPESFPIPASSQLLGLLAVAVWLVVRFGWKSFSPDDWNAAHWRTLGGAHALLLAAAAWSFHTATVERPTDFGPPQQALKVPVEDAVLVTDQGRIFSVFRFETGDRTFEDKSLAMFEDKIVRVASPDPQTNCHGWVFANGEYAIPSAAVAAILHDNGYAVVESPLPGDVIVYRGETDDILHSGCVRRAHDDGQVWIESKWGPGGRYLHLPQDQCYSDSFVYYRSTRPSHAAQIVRTPIANDGRVARSDDSPRRPARG